MKKRDQEQVCGCGCGFRTTIQPLFRLHEMVERAEQRAKEQGTPDRASPDTPPAQGREETPKEGSPL